MLLNKFKKDEFINESFEMKCLFCYNDNTYIQGKLVRTGKDYPLEIKLYNWENNNYSYVSNEEFNKIDEKLKYIIEFWNKFGLK